MAGVKRQKVMSAEEKTAVKDEITNAFSSWAGFYHYIADHLEAIIEDVQDTVIDSIYVKFAVKRFLKNRPPPSSPAEKVRFAEAKIILMGCYVYILMKQPEAEEVKWNTTGQLLEEFPQFRHLSEEEQQLLVGFRNVVRMTMLLMPGERYKKTILQIAGRLQGVPKDYVTGGGPKEEVTHRVQIYERTTGVTAKPRPERAVTTPAQSSISIPKSRKEKGLTADASHRLADKDIRISIPNTQLSSFTPLPTAHPTMPPTAVPSYAAPAQIGSAAASVLVTHRADLDDIAFIEAIEAISSDDDAAWRNNDQYLPQPVSYQLIEDYPMEQEAYSDHKVYMEGSASEGAEAVPLKKRKLVHAFEESLLTTNAM